jgi:hypothetical protein
VDKYIVGILPCYRFFGVSLPHPRPLIRGRSEILLPSFPPLSSRYRRYNFDVCLTNPTIPRARHDSRKRAGTDGSPPARPLRRAGADDGELSRSLQPHPARTSQAWFDPRVSWPTVSRERTASDWRLESSREEVLFEEAVGRKW